jgi:hypothetical protein
MKKLKLSKKTISSLTDLEMSYVKGAYGLPGISSVCGGGGTGGRGTGGNGGTGGGSGSQCSQYGCPAKERTYYTNLHGTFTSQGCVGLSTC